MATDYSSDSELANNQTHQSSSESPEILCAIIPKAAKQPAPSERCASVPKDDKPVDESEHISKKSGNTFASIIMGGRSPEQSDQTPNVGAAEAVNIVSDNRSVQSDVRPVKTMKRKRRIEFITTVPDDAESQQIAKVAAGGKSVTATADVKNMYENFKRSHVEFVDKSATCADTDVKVQPSASPSPSLATQAAGLDELREVIEAKLKFLCDGRPDVSAVQAISIQLEVNFGIVSLYCAIEHSRMCYSADPRGGLQRRRPTAGILEEVAGWHRSRFANSRSGRCTAELEVSVEQVRNRRI